MCDEWKVSISSSVGSFSFVHCFVCLFVIFNAYPMHMILMKAKGHRASKIHITRRASPYSCSYV